MTTVAQNENGYRIGESHHNCRWPDRLVRQARDLHELEGLRYEVIGARLGVPATTVEKWCQYISRNQSVHGSQGRRSAAAAAAASAALVKARQRRWPQRQPDRTLRPR